MSDIVERPDFKGRSGLLDAIERLNEAIDKKDAELARLRETERKLIGDTNFLGKRIAEQTAELARLREENETLAKDAAQVVGEYIEDLARLREGLDQKNIHEAALNNTIARLREAHCQRCDHRGCDGIDLAALKETT